MASCIQWISASNPGEKIANEKMECNSSPGNYSRSSLSSSDHSKCLGFWDPACDSKDDNDNNNNNNNNNNKQQQRPCFENILQGTNISPQNDILKMIFLFPRWDMLIPLRVCFFSKRHHVPKFLLKILT